jgi:hypothetical protein
VHLCIRCHRDSAEQLWDAFARAGADALARFEDVPTGHPIWADRPYKVFLHSPDDVRRVVRYIHDNPIKEGLPVSEYPFVHPYDGWPLRR